MPALLGIGVGAGKVWGCERFLPDFPRDLARIFDNFKIFGVPLHPLHPRLLQHCYWGKWPS